MPSQAAAPYERVGLLEGTVEADVAHASQANAIGTWRKLADSAPGDRQLQRELAASCLKIAEVEQCAGHTNSAIECARRAESIGQSSGSVEVEARALDVIRQVLASKGDVIGAEVAAKSKAALDRRIKSN